MAPHPHFLLPSFPTPHALCPAIHSLLSRLTALAALAHFSAQAAGQPTHLSLDISRSVRAQQKYASHAFQEAGHARELEERYEAQVAAEEAAEEARLAAEAAEAARVRKDPISASFHGGFEKRELKMVPVGGEVTYCKSATKKGLGTAPPLPASVFQPRDSVTVEKPTGGGTMQFSGDEDDGAVAPSAEALALLADPLASPRNPHLPPLPATSARMAPFISSDEPPQLPPPNVRMSSRVPLSVYGSERGGRVAAPTVSFPPAASNPNLMNLLLEVPYKRGVHTVSVNQRYLNHEPTFDAAFELLPARADFGVLAVGRVYRFPLKLVNVSNLSQRFSIKQNPRARLVFAPGAVAAGMALPLELEICEMAPSELREVLTIVTEREEISLSVSATVVDVADGVEPAVQGGVRMLAAAPRDPALLKTIAPTVNDVDGGTKRFAAPPRDPAYVKPDFFGEPPDEE